MNRCVKSVLCCCVFALLAAGSGDGEDYWPEPSIVTIEGAKKAIGGRKYLWKDKTGLGRGIPVVVYEIMFNEDASECFLSSYYITDDEKGVFKKGKATFYTGKYIDSGDIYVAVKCNPILGHSILIQSGSDLSINYSDDSPIYWFLEPNGWYTAPNGQ